MRRNYPGYNKFNTEKYSKGIKNSLYSLGSIIIGLLFTYLAMTNSNNDTGIKNIKMENTVKDEIPDYSFVSVKSDNDTKLGPPKENKEQNEKQSIKR